MLCFWFNNCFNGSLEFLDIDLAFEPLLLPSIPLLLMLLSFPMRGKLAMLPLENPLVDILGTGAYWLILIPIYLCFKPSMLTVKKVYNPRAYVTYK